MPAAALAQTSASARLGRAEQAVTRHYERTLRQVRGGLWTRADSPRIRDYGEAQITTLQTKERKHRTVYVMAVDYTPYTRMAEERHILPDRTRYKGTLPYKAIYRVSVPKQPRLGGKELRTHTRLVATNGWEPERSRRVMIFNRYDTQPYLKAGQNGKLDVGFKWPGKVRTPY